MNILRLLIFSAILLTISSCASFYATRDNLNPYITTWLDENNYLMIDKTFSLIDKSHPQYKTIMSRKTEIAKHKAAYISQTEHKAQQLRQSNKWIEAINEYDEAINQLPENKQLIASRAILVKHHSNLINDLKKQMLLKRAYALIEYESVYNELELLAPYDNSAQSDIQRHKNEKQEVANHLITCSEYALGIEDYTLAEECLQLASQLINTETVRHLLIKTKNKRKAIETQKRAQELLATYKSAYASGDLPKARFHINTLITLQPDHVEAIELKLALDREIKAKVDKGISEGRELYSQNNIKKALKIWKKLIIMDPDNDELKILISRAEKVSKKIETLSPSQKR